MAIAPTYQSWQHMIDRCTNRNAGNYHRYGGRGITICERWLVYENFLADMGARPAGKSLDRKDNDLGYEPGNCRWATPHEQSQNRRSNKLNPMLVAALRADNAGGMSYRSLGKKYGVSTVAARKVALGIFWPTTDLIQNPVLPGHILPLNYEEVRV